MAPPVILLNRIRLPENLGAIARIMKNFGLVELRLIDPQCEVLDPKAIALTAGAQDLLQQALIFRDLITAIADLTHLWATCADEREGIKPYFPPEPALRKIRTETRPGILLGPERTGLSNEEISHCQAVIQIPTNPAFTSLNIAQSLAVIGYEYFNQSYRVKPHLRMGETQPATQAQVTVFLNHLETALDQVNYWRQPTKKPLMWCTLQNIFTRLELTKQELQSLQGMIQRLLRHQG